MEDINSYFMEEQVASTKYICHILNNFNIKVSEAQVRNVIKDSEITTKDIYGNYTGSKQLLITSFKGVSDMDIIRKYFTSHL